MRTIIIIATTTLLFLPAWLYADDDDDDDDERRGSRVAAVSQRFPTSAGLTQYQAECGSCHLAYPPGMLPKGSWVRLLDGLADHFGENAELDPEVRTSLGIWLGKNAAEQGTHSTSKKVLKSARGESPLKISELRFIKKEHDEIDPAVFKRPAVKTVANCGACHLDAEQWSFSERRIEIPR